VAGEGNGVVGVLAVEVVAGAGAFGVGDHVGAVVEVAEVSTETNGQGLYNFPALLPSVSVGVSKSGFQSIRQRDVQLGPVTKQLVRFSREKSCSWRGLRKRIIKYATAEKAAAGA